MKGAVLVWSSTMRHLAWIRAQPWDVLLTQGISRGMQAQERDQAVLDTPVHVPLHELLAGAARGTGHVLGSTLAAVVRPFLQRQLC